MCHIWWTFYPTWYHKWNDNQFDCRNCWERKIQYEKDTVTLLFRAFKNVRNEREKSSLSMRQNQIRYTNCSITYKIYVRDQTEMWEIQSDYYLSDLKYIIDLYKWTYRLVCILNVCSSFYYYVQIYIDLIKL